MLQINRLTLTHRKDLRVILKEFDLVLNRGDKAVLIGEEGNGKSTLLKWIYDPALVSDYVEWEGRRSLQGERLGYLPQELPADRKELTVYDYFSGLDAFWAQSPRELSRLAGTLRLPDDLFYSEQRMGTLSGGERVKLQMAGLLMEQPDVLLLDEPSNDIDIETLEWMEEMIRSFDGIVLFISHDETLIERTANRVILMEQLRRKTLPRYTVTNMPFAQFMAERASGFEKQAQMAQSERREERKALEKFRRIQQSVEYAQNTVSRQDPSTGRLLKKKMASVKAYEELLELDLSPIAYLAPSGSKEDVTAVRTCLGAMKYTSDEMEHPIRELSGGQRAKVLLLRMSLSEADVLVLDEPTRNFSPLSGPEIRALLSGFPGAIISISHDRKYIDAVCGKVYRLTERGLVLERS